MSATHAALPAPLVPAAAGTASPAVARARVASVDAYRGLVMFLMLAEVLRSCVVASAVSSAAWNFVCFEQSHAAWVGASLHDLIQPSFYFLVGIGLAFSLRRRLASGQTIPVLLRHTLIRSAVLIVLGMALVSVHPRQWQWNFWDTLTQIGFGYPFLFLIALRPTRDRIVALAAILVGYWLLFALYPLPPAGFDYSAVGVPPEWLSVHGLSGFAAHWQKNSNAAWAFDRWFVNLFPVDEPYMGALNGLTTLNFIPSIGTMVLGLFAADVIRRPEPKARIVGTLAGLGLVLLAAGWWLDAIGVAPVVKAIWTPSWVLFSGGWCFLLLAGFYALLDLGGLAWLGFPLAVIGSNSIVAYALSHVYPALAFNAIRIVVGGRVFNVFGAAYEPFVYGCAVLTAYWLVLYLLYARRIFVRI